MHLTETGENFNEVSNMDNDGNEELLHDEDEPSEAEEGELKIDESEDGEVKIDESEDGEVKIDESEDKDSRGSEETKPTVGDAGKDDEMEVDSTEAISVKVKTEKESVTSDEDVNNSGPTVDGEDGDAKENIEPVVGEGVGSVKDIVEPIVEEGIGVAKGTVQPISDEELRDNDTKEMIPKVESRCDEIGLSLHPAESLEDPKSDVMDVDDVVEVPAMNMCSNESKPDGAEPVAKPKFYPSISADKPVQVLQVSESTPDKTPVVKRHAKENDEKDKSRGKRGRSKSRERRYSDSRRHPHRHSHSHRESSSSKPRDRYYESKDSLRRPSHSHHGSTRGPPSRSRPRTYNVRTQTDSESIIQEVGGMTSKTDHAGTTRVPWYPHPRLMTYKHRKYFRIETDPNGGADVCHMYWDEISHLSSHLRSEIALEFIKLTYAEDANEYAYHVIGIVHDAAGYLPDLVDYMADHYGQITVKTGSLTGRGSQSMNMATYRDEVYKTYSKGTFRYPPLQEISICGVQGEEVGAYFPDFVHRLEESPTMKHVMPWSCHSVVATDNPRESNDGPIFWVRPGEQTMPSCEGARSKGRIAKGVSRLSEAREALFEDRTKPHADQIGIDGVNTDTAPTAAVGVLKAVVCGNKNEALRATKDVIAFYAGDYTPLVDLLQIDVYEPPLKQCPMWLETAKLNSLRRQGIRFAHVQLHGNDVYYLPRKIIHQFQTISAVASVAWHVRWKDYFAATGAPNLHIPTGLNKGAVYYEKKNVPVYEPPIVDDLSDEECYATPSKKSDRSSSRTPRSRTKKSISETVSTPTKSETASPLAKVRKLDLEQTPSSRKEVESSLNKDTPSKRQHASVSTPSRRSSGSSTPASRLASGSTPSGKGAASTSTSTAAISSAQVSVTLGSTSSPFKSDVTPSKEKTASDRRRSADDAALERPSQRRSSLEAPIQHITPSRMQLDPADQKTSPDAAVSTPTKVEKPLRENILAKKKRKTSAPEEKPVSYDVLGDIMQQMDKSKSF